MASGKPAGIDRRKPRLLRRALLTVAVSWMPLVLLTALRGDLIRSDMANSFLLDFGAQARFLRPVTAVGPGPRYVRYVGLHWN